MIINSFNFIFWVAVLSILHNRNNLLLSIIALETSYLIIILLIAMSSSRHVGLIENQAYCLLFLVLAASESATGLAVLIICYKYTSKTVFTTHQLLHG